VFPAPFFVRCVFVADGVRGRGGARRGEKNRETGQRGAVAVGVGERDVTGRSVVGGVRLTDGSLHAGRPTRIVCVELTEKSPPRCR
jgi:hypothetical protein